MLDVLVRAAAVGLGSEGSVTAANAVRSVAGWLLPEDVRAVHFTEPAHELSEAGLACFVAEWCVVEERRTTLARWVVELLIDGRWNYPASAREAIEHLCAYTICYGYVPT
jgi:hypothetical protein